MSYTKEQIFERIQEVLEEQFEIEAADISMNASLQEDLDIDSIDAVDLMIELKSLTKKKMSLEDFHEVKTVSDVVEAVFRVMEEDAQQPANNAE
jgi:acyl carrier protein